MSYKVLAGWNGYCAPCASERPLLLLEHGPRGLGAWWRGVGAEQRTLSYACGVCGQTEHVPATEAEDLVYDATLLRWPDWVASERLVASAVATAPVVGQPVLVGRPVSAATAVPAVRMLPAQRRPVVTVVSLPTQRVSVTDGPLIAA